MRERRKERAAITQREGWESPAKAAQNREGESPPLFFLFVAIPCLHLSPCGGSSSISLSFVGGFSLLSLFWWSLCLFFTSTNGEPSPPQEKQRGGGRNHHHRKTGAATVLLYLLCLFPFCGGCIPPFFGGSFCFVRQHTSICTHLLLASISRIVSSGSSLVFSHSFVFRARVCLTMTFCDIHLHGSRNNSLEKHRT